ncbi:MAG: hypothetical protein AUJ57_03445 [Zetaproteobacteria bacterium CG1_02_53_45]|nr:MAG: hypothetical protein AUJ57_03445 [Zetaproteobacteria bacterium CG1_02_53_45]
MRTKIISILLFCLFTLGMEMVTAGMAEAGLGSVTYKVVRSDGSTLTAAEKMSSMAAASAFSIPLMNRTGWFNG